MPSSVQISVEMREKKGGGDTFPIAPPLIFNNPRAKRRSSKHRERCIHLWRTHSFRKDTLECNSFDDALQRASAILARPGVRDVARSSKPFWIKGILKTLTQKWIKTTRKDYLKRRAWRTCIFLEYQEKHIKTCIDTRFIRSHRISARKLLASIYALDKYISHFSSAKQSLQNPQPRERLKRKFRNRYLLVAVRSPDHHGLFVDDLTGGDGVDLLDVLDLGNGLHDYLFMYVRL
jgi:hypothetical protein